MSAREVIVEYVIGGAVTTDRFTGEVVTAQLFTNGGAQVCVDGRSYLYTRVEKITVDGPGANR